MVSIIFLRSIIMKKYSFAFVKCTELNSIFFKIKLKKKKQKIFSLFNH